MVPGEELSLVSPSRLAKRTLGPLALHWVQEDSNTGIELHFLHSNKKTQAAFGDLFAPELSSLLSLGKGAATRESEAKPCPGKKQSAE